MRCAYSIWVSSQKTLKSTKCFKTKGTLNNNSFSAQHIRILRNSSSAFSEGWGVTLHSDPEQMAANRRRDAFIQYADLTELMLMLDMRLGGRVMEAVNVGQRLVRPRTP